MKTFKQFINEAFQQVDIPYDGRSAPTRYNNPGGAYPKSGLEQYGMEGYGIIGGGHKIAKYPSPAHGVAANIAHLRSMPIEGRTVGEARNYWVTGNMGGFKDLPGMDSNQVITRELLQDQNWLAAWMVATAKAEGYNGALDQSVFTQAFNMVDGQSSYDPSKVPEFEGSSSNNSSQMAGGDGKKKKSDDGGVDYASVGAALGAIAASLGELGNYGQDTDGVNIFSKSEEPT